MPIPITPSLSLSLTHTQLPTTLTAVLICISFNSIQYSKKQLKRKRSKAINREGESCVNSFEFNITIFTSHPPSSPKSESARYIVPFLSSFISNNIISSPVVVVVEAKAGQAASTTRVRSGENDGQKEREGAEAGAEAEPVAAAAEGEPAGRRDGLSPAVLHLLLDRVPAELLRVVGVGPEVLEQPRSDLHGARRLPEVPHVRHALRGRPPVPQVQEHGSPRLPRRARDVGGQEEDREKLKPLGSARCRCCCC